MVLKPIISESNIVKLSEIARSILCLSHPVTTRSIARISSLGLRTLERFYAENKFNWTLLRVYLFTHFFYDPNRLYILAGDETVEKKAGKHTYGLGRFYSSLFARPIPSVSFLGLSVIDTQREQSHFLSLHQLVKPSDGKATKPKDTPGKAKGGSAQVKRSKGRPKGSKNSPYQEPDSLSFQSLKKTLIHLLVLLRQYCPGLTLAYLVLDGFYGNGHYVKLSRSNNLHLISKLRCNSHLILPYQGKQKKLGRRKKLGKQLNYDQIPKKYQVRLPKDHPLQQKGTKVFQLQAYHPKIKDQKLNIVIIQHQKTGASKIGQSILMSTDLTLFATQMIQYYSLRFQIEFDFRDAKQYFGLSHFKNYKKAQVITATNLAFTMTLIARILLEKYKDILHKEELSILDLKACLKAQMYLKHLLNRDNMKPDDFLKDQMLLDFIKFEAIHL